MPSAYEIAVDAFRARLLRVDATAMQAVTDAYAPIRTELRRKIADLESVLPEARSASDLYRLQRYKSLIAQIDSDVTELAGAALNVTNDGQASLVSVAQDEVRALTLAQVTGTGRAITDAGTFAWNQLNTDAMRDLVGRLSDGSPLRDYLDGLPNQWGDVISNELVRGVTLGLHPRQISQLLENRLDGQVARLLTTTRTAMLDSYRSASIRSMQANADILDGWQWQAAHDSRTCLACLALDGKMFSLDTSFMPSHPGCRCSPRPVVTGATPSQRQTGAEWFASQPESVQRQMLPNYAYDGYQSGKVKLIDFAHLDKDDRWGDRYRVGSVKDKVA